MAGSNSTHSVCLSINPSTSGASKVDVSSATLISVQSKVENTSVELDSSCVIQSFQRSQNGFRTGQADDYCSCIQLPSGRITRWSAVSRSSRTVKKSVKMFLNKREYFMGTTGGGDVSDRFNFNGGGT